MESSRQGPHDVTTIGLVGADGFVSRAVSLARQQEWAHVRVVAAICERETDAGVEASRISENVDALLFAGPLPYDVAMRDADLAVPAAYVPTGGPALLGTLVRAMFEGLDPRRLSIDSIPHADVRDAYDEVGLPSSELLVQDYSHDTPPGVYEAFHRDAFAQGMSVGAATTFPSVAANLRRADVPVLHMTPSVSTLREALRTTVLRASGARFDEARIAIALVQVPEATLPPRASPATYWYQELRLDLHRVLLQEAKRMEAIVLPHDTRSFMVIMTMGSLRAISLDLQEAPFVKEVERATRTSVEVGIGLGQSTLEAEANAFRAVARTAELGSGAVLVGPDGPTLHLAKSAVDSSHEAPARDSRDMATLRALHQQLSSSGRDTTKVDAEIVAELLDVTPSSGRRTLRTLAAAGLAWPTSAAREGRIGRPPMVYRLMDPPPTADI